MLAYNPRRNVYTHLEIAIAACVDSKVFELRWMYGIGRFEIRGGCEGVRKRRGVAESRSEKRQREEGREDMCEAQ